MTRTAVRFETTEYTNAHGRTPSGRGSWAFIETQHAKCANRFEHIIYTHNCSYTEAKSVVVSKMRNSERHSGQITSVTVCA